MKKEEKNKVDKNRQFLVEQYKETSIGLKQNKYFSNLGNNQRKSILPILPCIVLGMAVQNEAKAVVMTRAVNQTITTGAGSFDLDNDGNNDFRWRVIGSGMGVQALTGNTVSVLQTASAWFSKLGFSANIPSGGNFRKFSNAASYNGISFISTQSSPWNMDGGTGFLGLKFKIGSNLHLAWAQLDVNHNAEGGARNIKVIKVGWETNLAATSITTASALPVELLDFHATLKNNNVNLYWQTATETNNAGFEIERSEDSKNFRSLAWVEGHGTTLEQQEYLFDDKNLRQGRTYYYRLKQVDFDGTFEYSKIISVTLKGGQETVSEFFPNPAAQEYATVNINTEKGGQWTAQIFDATGKAIHTEQRNLDDGKMQWQLDLSGLSQGLYFVKFGNGHEQYYRKLVVE